MPYDVKKTKTGYEVRLKSTGKVVARPKDMKGVRGYIWHATKAEDIIQRIDLVLGEQNEKNKKKKKRATQEVQRGETPRIEGGVPPSTETGVSPLIGAY